MRIVEEYRTSEMRYHKRFAVTAIISCSCLACCSSSSSSVNGTAFRQNKSSLPVEFAQSLNSPQARLRRHSPFFVTTSIADGIAVHREGQLLLHKLKDAILTIADESIPRLEAAENPNAELKQVFLNLGYDWASDGPWVDAALEGIYTSPPEHPSRRVVELCILLAPGSDCILAIYEITAQKSRRVLTLRNDDDDSIEGAIHNLYWALSPPDADGNFFLVEAHTHPWPSSRWRSFSYQALAPSAHSDQALILASAGAVANLEGGYRLKTSAESFVVSFSIWSDKGPDFQTTSNHEWQRKDGKFHKMSERTSYP